MHFFDTELLKRSFIADFLGALDDLFLIVATICRSNIELSSSVASAAASFSDLPDNAKAQIIVDPRVISNIENLQRLISDRSYRAIEDESWVELVSGLLRIGLGAAVMSGKSLCYREISPRWQSFTIPGTDVYLAAPQEYCGDLELKVVEGVISPSRYKLMSPSFADVGGLILALPEYSLRPPIAQEQLLTLSQIEKDDWKGQLSQASKLLAIDAISNALVHTYGRIVVPMRDERPGVLSSVSFDSHPGAVFTSWCEQAEMLAETLVHESDHQRHYLFSRIFSIWEESCELPRARYRSPWRNDPRPLDGILRGASAFVSVGRFWAKVDEASAWRPESSDWVRERAVYTNYQAIDALTTLSLHRNLLAKSGNGLLDYLTLKARETRDILVGVRDFNRFLSAAERLQAEHDQLWFENNVEDRSYFNKIDQAQYLNF